MFQAVNKWFSSKGGFAHVAATTWVFLVGAYALNGDFKAFIDHAYALMPAWSHQLILAGLGLIAWYKSPQRKAGESAAAAIAKGVGAGILMTALFLTGCAVKNQTPQYNVAKGINDFAHALKGFQDVEIGVHDAGLIPDDTHIQIEKAIRSAYGFDALAETAAKTGDLTTAKAQYQAALTVLQNIQPQMVGVKNPNSQAELKAALQAVISIAQDWAGVTQSQ